MSLTVDIVQGPTQVPSTGIYEGTSNSAVVLYNPLQDVEIPTLPPAWLTVHQSAVSSALAAGATTYAISKLSGQLFTYTFATGIRLSGTVLSEGARIVNGDASGQFVSRQTDSLSGIIQTVGDTCTNVTSMVTSATVAAVVGATTMLGSMCYNLYQAYKPTPAIQIQPYNAEVVDSYDYEFVVCDVKPLLTAPPEEFKKTETLEK